VRARDSRERCADAKVVAVPQVKLRLAIALSMAVFVACAEGDPPDPMASACAVDPDCDDGVFCNGAERCHAGVCASRTPIGLAHQ